VVVDDEAVGCTVQYDLDQIAVDDVGVAEASLSVGGPEGELHSGCAVGEHDDADAVKFVDARAVTSSRVLELVVCECGQVEAGAIVESRVAVDRLGAKGLVGRRAQRIGDRDLEPVPALAA
jgi:hypothetical protein